MRFEQRGQGVDFATVQAHGRLSGQVGACEGIAECGGCVEPGSTHGDLLSGLVSDIRVQGPSALALAEREGLGPSSLPPPRFFAVEALRAD